MRICVFGAGAIGGNFAARLAAAGNEVSVVARGKHLEAIRAQGLKLKSGDQTIVGKVQASDNPAELGPQDVVISTLKASSLGDLAKTIGPLLRADTPVVFAQNGIPWWYARGLSKDRPKAPDLSRLDPDGALQKAVGFDRALGGVITSSNHVIEPGVIHNISPERNVLWVGELDDKQTPRIEALRKVLIGAGIASPSTTDIRYDIWHKLMANLCGSTLCQITGLAIPMQGTPLMNRLVRRAHTEALAVAAAHGIVLKDSPEERYGPKRVYPNHRPSILQDYELGRPMEVEAIVRAPLAFARAAKLDTPVLDAVESLTTTMADARGLYAS